MKYEFREWFGDERCLYTDDLRLRDEAAKLSGVTVGSAYFKSPASREAFAWDIVGDGRALARLARHFSSPRAEAHRRL